MKVKIVFLLMPDVHLLNFAGPDQVFFEAIESGAKIETHYIGLNNSINSSNQLQFKPLKTAFTTDLSKGDFILIPGSSVDTIMALKESEIAHVKKWIQTSHMKGVNICSICSGAFLLARTGLLNFKKCTTHWKRTKELQLRFPRVKVQEDVLFVEDEGIFSSAGVTAGVDMALHILEKITNEGFAFNIARELVVYNRRSANQSQQSKLLAYRNHIHSGIHRAQDYIQHNLNKKINIEDLAGIACMSTRSLTRIFKKEAGITIQSYLTLIRKEQLTQMLQNPDLTRKKIASLIGLKSERQVLRLINSL